MNDDFKALGELAEKMARLSREASIEESVAKNSEPYLTKVAGDLFVSQVSPYGDPWAGTYVMNNGKAPTLHRTGELAASATTYAANGSRVGGSLVNHGRFHYPKLFIPVSGKVPPKFFPPMKKAFSKSLTDIGFTAAEVAEALS